MKRQKVLTVTRVSYPQPACPSLWLLGLSCGHSFYRTLSRKPSLPKVACPKCNKPRLVK